MTLPDLRSTYGSVEDRFPVIEVANQAYISTGIARNPADKLGRLAVVTERYLDVGYIKPEDLNQDGLYVDSYEGISMPIVAKIGSSVVGSFRLIPNTEMGLPVNHNIEIDIHPDWRGFAQKAAYELSQFANLKKMRKDHRIAIGVIKAYMAIADQIGKNEAVAIIDDRVIAGLNGPYSGFGIPTIGNSVYYLGSSSTPVYINTDNIRQNAEETGHKDLARFLRGERNVPGYNWYVGP